jgi:DNA-binding transcriptional MerR regulator
MNPRTHDKPETAATAQASLRFGMEEAIARAGISERLLRQCEARGLIQDTFGRGYTHEHVGVLRFVRRAHALGFGMGDIGRLLALRQDEHRMSAEVKLIAITRTEELESHIEELQATKRVLERLAGLCLGDHQPACPILDELLELRGFSSQPATTASASDCRCAPASR